MNQKASEAITQRIRAMVISVLDTVSALHKGDLYFEIKENTPASKIRWSPKMAKRSEPLDEDSKAFTIFHIANHLHSTETMGKGKRKASLLVKVACKVCELTERGVLTEADVDRITRGGRGMRVSSLWKQIKNL